MVMSSQYSNSSLDEDPDGFFKRPEIKVRYARTPIQYTREQMYRVREQLPSLQQKANQTMMNATNADVTLEDFNNSTRNFSGSTIYEDDYTRLAGEESVIGEVREVSDLSRHAHLYVNRRALNNMKHQIIDSWVPFSNGWRTWVPDKLSHNEALAQAEKLVGSVNRLDDQKTDSFMLSMNVVKQCQVCQRTPMFNRNRELLMHFLSREHVNSIYLRDRVISSLDIAVLEAIIEEITKSANFIGQRYSRMNALQASHQKSKEFFKFADVLNCFDSLKSLTTLTASVPMMNAPIKGEKCEYIESIVLLHTLEENFMSLSQSELHQSILTTSPRSQHCEVCHEVVEITHLLSFCLHLYSTNHLKSVFSLGINRNEAEWWYNFCNAVREKKRPRSVSFQNDRQSLQEMNYPLCSDDDDPPHEVDIYFKDSQRKQVMDMVKSLISEQALIEDQLFASKFFCSWCNVPISTKLQFIEHILYSKRHYVRLPYVYVEDIRFILHFVGVKCSAPLLAVPSTCNTECLNEKELPIAINQFRRKIRYASNQNLCSNTTIAIINFCELCDKKLEHIEDVVEHLVGDEHWDNNKYTRRTYQDFVFWTNISNKKN